MCDTPIGVYVPDVSATEAITSATVIDPVPTQDMVKKSINYGFLQLKRVVKSTKQELARRTGNEDLETELVILQGVLVKASFCIFNCCSKIIKATELFNYARDVYVGKM